MIPRKELRRVKSREVAGGLESDTRDRRLQRKEGWLEIEKGMALSLEGVAAAGNDRLDQGQGGRTSVEEGDKAERGYCWSGVRKRAASRPSREELLKRWQVRQPEPLPSIPSTSIREALTKCLPDSAMQLGIPPRDGPDPGTGPVWARGQSSPFLPSH